MTTTPPSTAATPAFYIRISSEDLSSILASILDRDNKIALLQHTLALGLPTPPPPPPAPPPAPAPPPVPKGNPGGTS